jgi:monoamine oxidase
MDFLQHGLLSRRAMLLGIGSVAASPLTSRFSWAQGLALPREADVVIVGAGAAGLAAARGLMSAGRSVVIVEAMDRIGGRAWTDTTTFGFPFDRGCAWIHAADRNPLHRVAEELRLTLRTHDFTLDRIYYGERPRRFDRRQMQREQAVEKEIEDRAVAAAKRDDGAVSTLKNIVQPEEQAAATYIGPMDMAVDLDRLSIQDLGRQEDLDPNHAVKEGFGAVVAHFGQGLPVALFTPVTRIRYGGPGVVVETDKGDIRAHACVVTVSTGALASERIRFDPPLPVWKQEAIAQVPMGMLAKIPLLTDGARFGLGDFDDVLCERPGKHDIYFTGFHFGRPLLVGFVGGDFAWELSTAGKDAAIDFALDALRRTFGSDAPKRVRKADFTNWASNPWVRGAYAAALPGKHAQRDALARPVANRVFFAGEALAHNVVVAGRTTSLAQTAGGAVLSGWKTAEAVNLALRG